VFDVLKLMSEVRHDALYVRLLRQPDGVAIGHTAMPKLPSSHRQVMVGSGRSDITQFVSSAIRVIPTDRVMSGSAEFEITIDKNAGTELAPTPRPPHHDTHPPVKPMIPESGSKPGKQLPAAEPGE